MILVTGATGNVGTELVAQLARAKHPRRAIVRSEERFHLLHNVETVTGDLNEPESLGSALLGVRSVFLLGGFRDMPGLVKVIRDSGAQHIVLLSSRSVVNGSETNAIVKMWMVSEDAVRSSGISWTILRPSGFMSNALRWLPQVKVGDTIRAPFADVPTAAIDPFDIAAVATVTLTTDGHSGRVYELSGPNAMLPGDQVRILAEVLGRKLRFHAQPDAEAKSELRKQFSDEFADAMFRFYAEGEFDDSPVVQTVRELSGRAPRAFDEWARAHAGAFAVT